MWISLDAAGFLGPPLAFAFRKNEGYFNFNAISVYKVYIGSSIKKLGRFFVTDKKILTGVY